MKVYYTGATKFEGTQQDPFKSIGGLISSSIIPNDTLGNIFDGVSKFGLYQTDGVEYRVIAIYNDSSQTYTNLRVFAEFITSITTDVQAAMIGLGYLSPTVNACGDVLVEELPSIYSKPYGATIVESAINETTAYSIPALPAGMYMGIVIARRLNTPVPPTSTYLTGISDGTIVENKQEKFNINFLWD